MPMEKKQIKDVAILQRIEDPPVLIHPVRIALTLAIGYCTLGLSYIFLSSHLALDFSSSRLELYQIELLKGIGFIVVSSVLLFSFAFWILCRLAMKEIEVRKQRKMLIVSENRAVAGLFASSVAHDINNVLVVSEIALGKLSSAECLGDSETDIVAKLKLANSRLAELSRRLTLAGGRHLPSSVEQIDMALMLRQTIDIVRMHTKVKFCTLDLSAPESLYMNGEPSLIYRMVLNLVLNAADATGSRGNILVKLSGSGDQVSLEVHDDGPGISGPQLEQIFMPLFTTKKDGSGLGLISVKTCAEFHKGEVDVVRSDLGGACFRVVLHSLPL